MQPPMTARRRSALLLPLALLCCGTPGALLVPAADDFAFLEVKLRG